ncbi:ninein-like [Embiotoca jacksoni]|uniref:ninein-like n=1 Tax=Embiotoca jacksoni TaxID=100190 RepID=UPI0037048532
MASAVLLLQDIEVSFNQRIGEVEDRFSGDQESVAERFQADVLKLEQHYQSELRALADGHRVQELQWKARTKAVQESGEQQREEMEEALRRQADRLRQEWTGETQQLEDIHREEVEALAAVNKQLHAELEELAGRAQTKEIELSRQLNDLHGRLQESLNGEQELLARSESRALATELLLSQTVEDFEQEREELLGNTSQLEERYSEVLSVCERQSTERVELLAERDHLKMKVEEVEMVLQQAALDFELERQELQEHLSILEDKLKDHRENDEEELGAERKELQIKEVEVQRLQRCGDEFGGRSPEEEEPCDEGCEVTRCDHADPEPQNQQREAVASLEAFGDGGKRDVLVSREEVDKPREHASHEDKQHHETAVVSPEETGDGGGLTMEDHCSQEVGSERGDEEEECPPDEECSARAGALLNAPPLQENVLLQEKIELLQQKTELLENLLAHNAEKLKTGQQVLEENYGLKVKMLLLMEHLKTLETKVLKMTELQIRYEDCMCENGKLKEQNGELERRVWSLEGGVDVMDVLHGDQVSLVDEISQLRDQNTKLSELFQELDLSDGAQPEHMEGLGDKVSLDLDRLLEAKERATSDPEAKERAVSDLEDVCREFEKQNVKLRRAITELQDRSQSLNETTQAHG